MDIEIKILPTKFIMKFLCGILAGIKMKWKVMEKLIILNAMIKPNYPYPEWPFN